MSSRRTSVFRNNRPFQVGLILSAILLVAVISILLTETCPPASRCQPRWQELWNGPTNQIGDSLSGVGSVFAFIWLVMTAWMQSIELTRQREELRAQRDEWRRVSDAQELQVRALEEHARIFSDEARRREGRREERP